MFPKSENTVDAYEEGLKCIMQTWLSIQFNESIVSYNFRSHYETHSNHNELQQNERVEAMKAMTSNIEGHYYAMLRIVVPRG